MSDTSFSKSYVLTDAILEAYIGANPKAAAIALKALAAASQEWYCREATRIIDNLPLKGVTYYEFTTSLTPESGQQNRQFPRVIDGIAFGWVPSTSLPEVPQEVIDACCEEAIALYEIYNSSDKTTRLSLQRQGVISASYSGTSETYAQNPSGSISGAGNRYKGLMSKEAYDLLKGYIAGAIEATFG